MNFLNNIPLWVYVSCIFSLGLMIGSFLNVCIHRLPKGNSVVTPRSYCPICNKMICAKDNIPILSYIVLKGRCRDCKQSISWVYPTVELITAFFLTMVFLKFGPTFETGIYGITVSALVVITVIDLQHQIIPDRITIPGILFGFVCGTYLNSFSESFIGFFIAGGLFYFLALVSKGGMGGGDIKLIAGAGALLGWQKILLVIFIGSLLGTFYSLPHLLTGKKSRKSKIPFGPFLSAGIGLTIFKGREFIFFYMNYMNC